MRRAGGFLSLVLIDVNRDHASGSVGAMRLTRVADRLRRSARLQDVVAVRGSQVALVLPHTSVPEATRAAERFLKLARDEAGFADGSTACPQAAGVAAAFGEVEGGAEALLAAAEEALRGAQSGQVAVSRELQGRPRILVVDDDVRFAEALAETISENGWEGHPCSNVEDARQRVESETYNGVFVDLVLRGGTGVEIVRRSTACHPRRPVILMSGHDASHEAVLEALTLGPVTFLAKPISSADLERTLWMVRELLPGARTASRRDLRPSRGEGVS